MIKNILTQIWNQRRSNGWLFAELLIVFTLLWYCIDILYNYTYAEYQSKGYDIEYTYRIEMHNNPTQTLYASDADSLAEFWWKPVEEVLRRIRNYPGIEAVSLWMGTDAYSTNYMHQAYTADSVNVKGANIRYVSGDYGNVFRTEMLRGGWERWDAQTMPIPAIVSEDLADSLFHRQDVLGEEFYDYYAPQLRYRVAGVMTRQKNMDYSPYTPYIITPMRADFYRAQYLPNISVRVRPEDSNGFARRFIQEMTPQLQVPPFFLFNVQSYEEQKLMRDAAEGITPYIKAARLIVLFFISNVFLGLMGTFWFRTRHRRSEIGLRMAMGASRRSIQAQLIWEGLLLLALAAVPAIMICAHMQAVELIITEPTEAGTMRFVICILLTWLLMAVMTWAGIWFPARQAMAVRPAEALHDE